VSDPRPETPEQVTARLFAEAQTFVADMPAPAPVGREALAKLGRPLPAFYTPPVKRGRRSRLHDAVFRIKIK
jgi:hypothetical protein